MKKILPTTFVMLVAMVLSARADDTSGILKADSLPEAWTYNRQFLPTAPSDDKWWTGFDDPILTSLITRAQENNYDMLTMLRRIEAARVSWQSAKAAYYPTLGADAGWQKMRSSGKTVPGGVSSTQDYFSLGLSLNWEIDVFGRVRENSKAGKAAYMTSQADYISALQSLCANIAKGYFNLRSVQSEIDVAITEIQTQEKIVAITEARFETGLSSKLDVAQAKTVLYSTQASLPGLEAMEQTAILSLAQLCGCFPEEIRGMLEDPKPLPNPFANVATGVPADLLRRRPDVAAAEYELARCAALVGVAKKDFLPTLSLTGSIGTSARRLDDLFSGGSLTYSVAPTLSWTIFDGLARNYRTAEAKQNMLAAIDNYNSIVTQAYTETEQAMTTYTHALQKIDFINKVNEQCNEALNLSVDRYKQGLSNFYDVMSSLLNTLDYRNTLVESKLSALNSLVQIYTSLGGDPQIKEN